MSKIIEDYKRRQKEKQKEEEKTSSSANTSSSSGESRIISEYKARKSIDYDTFDSDLAEANALLNDIGSNWQTEETMANSRSAVESMYNRLVGLRDYNKEYGNTGVVAGVTGLKTSFDEMNVPYRDRLITKTPSTYIEKQMTSPLDSLIGTYDKALKGWDERAELYGGFKNADAYNVAKKNAELTRKYSGLSYDEVQEEKKKHKVGSDEYNFLDTYTGYTDSREFKKALEAEQPNKDILDTIEKYESEIEGYRNGLEHSNGRGREGYEMKLQNVEREYAEYLKSIGYASGDEARAKIESKRTYDGSDYYDSLSMAKNKHELEYGAVDEYKDVMNNEDFEEASTYVKPNLANPNFFSNIKAKFTEADEDVIYAFVNSSPEEQLKMQSEYDGLGFELLKMTEDEKKVYNALYSYDTENGTNRASEFRKKMNVAWKKRVNDTILDTYNEVADESGFLGDVTLSAASVAGNVLGGATNLVQNGIDLVSGNEYNPYANGRMPSNISQSMRGAVASNIAENTNFELFGENVASFLYQTGMSRLDSLAGGLTMGSAYTVLMGANAYQQKAKELTEQGFDNTTVQANALVSGALEVVFEKIGFDNLVKMKDADSLAKVFVNGLKQAGVEGLEELGTEIGNIIADKEILGENSEFTKMYRDLIARGYTDKEASSKIAMEITTRLGFATAGGFLAGYGVGGGYGISGYNTNKSTGSTIRSGENGVADTFNLASLTPEESSAYKAYTEYANKGVTAENITDAQLGNLYGKTRESYGNTFNEAQEKYVSESERVDSITERLANHKKGGKYHLQADERRNLKAERKTAKQNVATAEESYIKALGDVSSVNALYTKGVQAQKDAKNRENTVKEAEKKASKLNVGEVTEVTSTGNSAHIEGIKVEEDKVSVITSEGEMSVKDMTFSDRDAYLVAVAEQISSAEGDDVASLFLKEYDGQTDIEEYRSAFNLMSSYAKGNFSADTILKHKGVLSTEQAQNIYSRMVQEPRIKKQKKLESLYTEMKDKIGGYTSTIDDSIIDYNSKTADGSRVNWNSLNERQRNSITFVKQFAEAMGINISFYQSKVVNGKRKGANGKYNTENNTISIDVYAGIEGIRATSKNKDTIISTFSHELTHWMKEKSPKLYHEMGDRIIEILKESGKTEEQLYDERRVKMSNRDTATEDNVRDEIIARACEDMLSMSEEGRRIFESMTEEEQKGFVAKVKEFIKDLIEWIDNLLNEYKSDSEEASTLREHKEALAEISKMWDEMLVKSKDINKALEVADVFGNLTNGISKDGTTIMGENALQMSDRTYREGGRDFLINWLDGHRGLTEADKQDIIDQTDRIAELMRAIENEEDLPDYSNWANMEVVKDENGEKVLSVIVKNGDYAMNIDFSQVCKKRVALNAVLGAMVQSGDLNVHVLSETDVADLNALIKSHDFEIACALCFVDSKRYRMGSWAESFCEGTDKKKNKKMVHQYGFNEMVRSLVPKGSDIKVDEFNFTGRDIKNQPTKNLLSDASDSELDFSLIDEIMEREFKPDGKSTDLYAYAKAIKEHKGLRKILNPAEIIESIGLDAIRLENKELYRLINRHQGTARPKFSHDVVAYGNDILKASNFNADKAKMVGGVRCQSFSDFMANMVVDYAQFISELSAKQLTSHTYTKEPLFVKLFGLTGMKINMSLVPKAIDMTPEQQEYFAILKDKNANKKSAEYKNKMKEYKKLAENAGLDENGNYIWEDETFPYDVAMDIVVDPRYSANCGTIAVGISDNHIRKLLADERISMVIPYHKSGLNHEVAMMRNIALYNDYTKVQSTRFSDGSKLKGVPDFDFYGDLYGVDGKEGTHDPKRTAQNYLAWCDENGYLPKFDEFRDDPNYYKLLVDFRVYDTDGTYREQQPVQTIYPSNKEFRDLILNGVTDKNGKVYGGLKQQQQTSDKLSRESQEIIEEYREMLKEKYGKDVLVQYDDRNNTESDSIKEQLAKHQEELDNMQTIASIDTRKTFKNDEEALSWAIETLKQSGDKVDRKGFGIVIIDEKRLKNGLRYLKTDAERVAYALIPKVIKRGIVIGGHSNHKERGYGTVTFAAPIDIDGVRGNMAIVVRMEGKNYYKLHRVLMPNGGLFEYKKESSAERAAATTSVVDTPTDTTFKERIPQPSEKVKENISNEQNSDRYEVTELTDDDYGNMKKHFGVTGNYNVAGYLLKSGHMLDFSGKHWGNTTSRTRQVDHREISEVLPDESNGVGAMVNMISNGNIRLMPEVGGINLAVKPSKNQRTILRRYIEYFSPKEGITVDIDAIGGDTIKSFTYDQGVSADRVMRDIDNYFKGGATSELMQFHVGEQFQDREDTPSVYDLMGENERLRKTTEILKADIENLKERLKLEKKVTGGNTFKESSLKVVADALRKKANSTISNEALIPLLKDVYSFVANSTESDMADENYWAELQARCYDVASQMVAESKPQMVMDDYPKMILRDIRNSQIWLSEGQKAELKHRYGDKWYNNLFGKIKTTQDRTHDLESKWAEWSAQYPDVFPADVNEAEMGIALIEAYDTLREASETIVEYDTEEMTRWLTSEVYNQYWNVSRFESTADKYEKRIKELNQEHYKAMKELRDSYAERIEKQSLVDDMYYGRKMNDLRKDRDAKLQEQHKADRIKAMELVKRIREQKEYEVSEAKRIGKERMDKYKEEAERKTHIQRITANTLALSRKLLKNSKEEHIPEVMKPVIADLVNALDFSSKRMLNKGIPTQKDISLYKTLDRVKTMMADANAGKADLEELYGHELDERIKVMVDAAFNTMQKFGDNEFILNNMALEDLATLDETVRFIKHVVNSVNKFHVANHAKGVANLSQETMRDMDSLGKAKLYDGLRANVSKMLNWGNAIPYYAFKRFGEGGRRIYEAFQDGWDKFAFNIKQIVDYANETYKADDVKKWDEDIKTFKILIPATESDLADPDYKPQYQDVQMTVSQIMSLYCLAKREQAKGHMLGGGIRVADFKTQKGKIVSQSDGAVLTQKDIDTITDTLTDRQKEVADKLQEFMNIVCPEWGNYVSMTRFGYKAFGEENYFPIQSDKNNLAVNDETEQNNSLFRLLNMSFAKSLTENANNRIVISNIFDVFAQHTSDMAKYNALALPVLDAFRWYNYTEKAEKGDGTFITKGVKQSIETAFGKDGQNYITTFLRDINGEKEVSRDTLGKGFYSKAKIASVGANLRVVLLQPTSYVRASAVINPKYLSKAFFHKPKIAHAEKYCGIALWKSMGYYDTNVQKGVEDLIKHNETFGDKATDIAMKGAEWADKVTWGYLWNACELEIRDTRQDLKVGSKEFFEAVGKRLRDVIYATQVVDSTMTRSQMMRSSDGWDKMLTAFASEPTLSYNMLQDAYMEYALDARRMGKGEALKKNAKHIARVVTAYTITNICAALVESGFDALRDDDDDDEKDIAYFMSLYLENFASDMSITGKIPYIKEIHSIIKGFGSSRTDTQWMDSFVQAGKAWGKVIGGEGSPAKAIQNSIKALSYVSGLPFYNAYRDALAVLDKTEIFTAEEIEEMFEDFFE